jgi:hypothetical protein
LRAKARVARWAEEKNIVAHEMQWTINSFKYCCETWRERAGKTGPEGTGLGAYGEKQGDLWESLQKRAEEMFEWARNVPKEERWRKKGPEIATVT